MKWFVELSLFVHFAEDTASSTSFMEDIFKAPQFLSKLLTFEDDEDTDEPKQAEPKSQADRQKERNQKSKSMFLF
jgi:hypothetical protein